MENQRRGERSAERRGAAIPRVVVASGSYVVFDRVGSDVEFVAAEVAADLDFISAERC